MHSSKAPYFIQSNKVLLSIATAFFLTNMIELFVLFIVSILARNPISVDVPIYIFQSFLIVSGLWVSFKIFKHAPIYLIALCASFISTAVICTCLIIRDTTYINEVILMNAVSTYILIFIWMHLTQNLKNKSRALKIGYFSYFIAIECLHLIPASIRGEYNIIFLLFALIGYKISSVIFELSVKLNFKLFCINTHPSNEIKK